MLNIVIKTAAILFGGYILGDLLSDPQEPQVVIHTDPPVVQQVPLEGLPISPLLVISIALLVLAVGYLIRVFRNN